MDKLLYTAMQGAMNAGLAQTTNSNNLANANTTGFKADFDAFVSLPVYGPGNATRATSTNERSGIDFNNGNLSTTDRPLDLAIAGEGWFAVQNEQGEEAYSRRADLRVSGTGVLTNGAGQPMMGESGEIIIPANQSMTIGKDGTISIVPLGQAVTTVAVIDRIKMVNPANKDLEKKQDGLFYRKDGEVAELDNKISLVSGALEGSNVNPIDAMVKMIEYSRSFEANTKMMKVAEELDQAASKLLSQS